MRPGYERSISLAHAINNSGQVVGVSRISPADIHATLWTLK